LFRLSERELRYITLPLPAVPVRLSAAAPAAGSSALDLAASPDADRAAARPWWKSPLTWTAAALAVAGATVVGVLLVERRDQTFSGNVPPGQISVR
jgi:hypothetical protein